MSKIIQKRVIVWFIAIIVSIFVSGCGGGGGGSKDPILGHSANIAAPIVVAVSPSNNDTNVSYTLKNISAEFSLPMDLTTLTTTSFTLLDANNLTAPVLAVTYADKVANLALSADLLPNTVYTATISTSVKSVDGIALLNNYVWNFTTGQIPNTIPPVVVAVTPVNNDTNVSYTLKNITAEFSVPMDLTTLNTTSFTLLDATNLTAPVLGVTYANKVANLALSADLLPNTVYTATINNSAKSADGIALLNNYVWNFTTGQVPDTIPPVVSSTSPQNGDTNVPITKLITATFSEAMMPLSITATAPATFSVTETNTPSVSIAGAVTYSVINNISAFKSTLDLTANTSYTATITTVSKDLAGNAMLNDYVWNFTTAAAPVIPPELVALGLSSTYGIAATAGITNTAATIIDGNVVLNPTATCNSVPITFANNPGFGACGGFAPSINGNVITPTNPNAITAQPITDDLRAAYLSIIPANMPGGIPIAAGTTLGAPTGNALVLGDNHFYTGVYTSNTSILITGDLTLDAQNDPNATFVFQSASTVGTAPNARILLINGAKASNVYWQAGSAATLQTDTIWNGNILAYGDITMQTGASSCGRLFAGAFTAGAFVLDSNRVSVPGNVNAPTGCE